MGRLSLRDATADDLEVINDIYNCYVAVSTCTYQTEPELLEERQRWFAAHDAAHPVIVAQLDGHVVGWGALSKFRDRAAYDHTVENSIYVRSDLLRQGIGKTLLHALLQRARPIGHHAIIASIDGEQAPSLAMHRAAGFFEAARLVQVGHKFGRWLDLIYLQLLL